MGRHFNLSYFNYSGKYMLPISLFLLDFFVPSTVIHVGLPGNVKFALDLTNFALSCFWIGLWPISDGRDRTALWCAVHDEVITGIIFISHLSFWLRILIVQLPRL